MTYKEKKIVIIGGGPAGISAAKFALQSGFINVTILEASLTLGGLHKDVEINGLHYDLGAFFFWENHNFLKLFPDIKKILVFAESSKHLSLTKKLNIDKYPLTLMLYIKENGLFDFIVDVFGLLFYRLFNNEKKCTNVDELMKYHMGPFYKKSGLKNYIRRLYNTEPKYIAIEFAIKRMVAVIEKFRFDNIFRALVLFKWKYLSQYEILENAWARPESGFGTMYAYIQDQLIKEKCNIFLEQKVEKIDTEKKTIETISGKIVEYDYLLSTQSLEATGFMLGLPFEAELKHRLLCSLFFEIPSEVVKDCFVLFNFSDVGKWKRVTFHSNYYNRTHSGNSIQSHHFVVESMPDDFQIGESNMVDLLYQDFISSFVGTEWEFPLSECKLVGHYILKNAYPVLDLNFDRGKVLAYKERLKKKNIFLVGRQGEFDYISSSDVSVNAIATIMEIIGIENQY